MNTLDRSVSPALHLIQDVKLLSPVVFPLGKNGEWIWMKEVNDETVQLRFVFEAGSILRDVLVAKATSSLLFSGSDSHSSFAINELFSKYGAYFNTTIGKEESSVTIYCLRSYFQQVMSVFYESIGQAIFPADELHDFIKDEKQSFLISEKKTSWLASRIFNQHFFANQSNYSRISTISDYDSLNATEIIDFHRNHYLNGLKRVVCVGALEEKQIIEWVNRLSAWNNFTTTNYLSRIKNSPIHEYQLVDDSVQTTIRIGIPLFNQVNADYVKFSVLNTVLGGYFGSRLMKNIREEKGYTYGIHSSIHNYLSTGYFLISTDVKKEVREETIREIELEINRLKSELIASDELELVKNYRIGEFLQMADGSDSMTYLFEAAHILGLGVDFYHTMLKEIREVSAEELRTLANQYLDIEKATIVQVG